MTDCIADNNRHNGSRVGTDCSVSGNRCGYNGSADKDGAGIYLDSSARNSRVEANHLTNNFRGLWFDTNATGNLAVRNSALPASTTTASSPQEALWSDRNRRQHRHQ